MGSSEIWDKYHECCICTLCTWKHQQKSASMVLTWNSPREICPISNTTRVVFIPNFHCRTHAIPC